MDFPYVSSFLLIEPESAVQMRKLFAGSHVEVPGREKIEDNSIKVTDGSRVV